MLGGCCLRRILSQAVGGFGNKGVDCLKQLIFFWCLAWVVFAIVDVSFDRSIFRAYTAIERSSYQPDNGNPRLLPNVVFEYRVGDNKVTRRTGSFVTGYDNCVVFDRDDWSCTYSDASGTIGVRQGAYFEEINLAQFPHLATLPQNETLSRFKYILLKCQWAATGGVDVIACLWLPFTT